MNLQVRNRIKRGLFQTAAVSSVILASVGQGGWTVAAEQAPDWTRLPVTIPEAGWNSDWDERVFLTDPSPAPWELVTPGFFWMMPVLPEDSSLLPDELRKGSTLLAKAGALLNYDYTPVGRYNELGAGLVFSKGADVGAYVPFLPIDLPRSVRGGRENWALPKTLADFADLGEGRMGKQVSGPGWSVRVEIAPVGPEIVVPMGDIADVMGSVMNFAKPLQDFLPRGQMSGMTQVNSDGQIVRPSGMLSRQGPVKFQASQVTITTEGSPELRQLYPNGTYPGGSFSSLGLHLE
ncbi:MAG: acetoacetate decarboxylase family protein [Mycobacteriaceae bacterium]